jgi:uncharacterized membrane protein
MGYVMRTTRDRIRHAISFEIIGILLVVPLVSIGFGMNAMDIGIVDIIASSIATLWNYVYNVLFDLAMKRIKGSVRKTIVDRIIHAFLFEGGLLLVTLPLLAYSLGVGLWQAFVIDVVFVLFYLVYTFVFNWVYDQAFPLPKTA